MTPAHHRRDDNEEEMIRETLRSYVSLQFLPRVYMAKNGSDLGDSAGLCEMNETRSLGLKGLNEMSPTVCAWFLFYPRFPRTVGCLFGQPLPLTRVAKPKAFFVAGIVVLSAH